MLAMKEWTVNESVSVIMNQLMRRDSSHRHFRFGGGEPAEDSEVLGPASRCNRFYHTMAKFLRPREMHGRPILCPYAGNS
jgi:hypothetical protein